jgi:hypothetical protein
VTDRRRNNIGFALQILQRRLASSPAAIHQSLKRRLARLEARLEEERLLKRGQEAGGTLAARAEIPAWDEDDIEEAPEDEIEDLETRWSIRRLPRAPSPSWRLRSLAPRA